MINGKKVVAIIPARGGSKGLPGKNIRDFKGKPLIAWSIESAYQSHYIDRVILSSDDADIIAVAEYYGCEVPFIRPCELATDEATSSEVVCHALSAMDHYDYVILLQPTSPLRSTADIDAAIELCVKQQAPACVSVTEVTENPQWMYKINQGKLEPIISTIAVNRRQDLPNVYRLNGALYIAQTDCFLKTKTFITDNTIPYLMHCKNSVDIDSLSDFQLAEQH